MLSIVLVSTAVVSVAVDWNATHLFNSEWHPHAKFHDAVMLWLLSGIAPKHHHHTHNDHHHSANSQVTLQSLLTLGIAGGLVPCPSALVLLLSAIALHQTVYGLLLVCAFSVGLAVVLITIGLVIIYAHQWLKGFSWVQPLQQYTPIISAMPTAGYAYVVIIVGSVLMACAVI
ncbi:DUF6640 family protein [Nostoc punctiforme]|uniref:DUF6640 family protein n=1 Tax=Nostoc punctiforme TaxID=272131 RepID=UPI0002EDEAFB|nr:DUF6640 family protein [Nostoc punctiforme]